MKHKTAIWVVLALIGLIVLALLPPIPDHPPKVRASRITGVNTMRRVTLTLTNVSAPSDGQLPIAK